MCVNIYIQTTTKNKTPPIFTLYQKFTVMVIPPFSNDSMWCHLLKRKERRGRALFTLQRRGWETSIGQLRKQ